MAEELKGHEEVAKQEGGAEVRKEVEKALGIVVAQSIAHLGKLKELADPNGRGRDLSTIDRDLLQRVIVDLEMAKGIAYGFERMDEKFIVKDDEMLQADIARKRREMGLE